MVNILRLTVAYLNATVNMKPETQNRRLEPTGLAKPGETRGLTGTGPGLARQESAGRVFGRFWNRTDPFLRSKPGPLAGYPDPLLTLLISPTDLSRCSQMLPDRPNAKRWALRCSKTTSLVLLNAQEVVEQSRRISWRVYSCIQNATESDY